MERHGQVRVDGDEHIVLIELMIMYSCQIHYDIQIIYLYLHGLNLIEHQSDDIILFLDESNWR